MWRETSGASASTPPPPLVKVPPTESRLADNGAMNFGKTIFIHGELTGSENCTFDGHMEGSVLFPENTVTIGPHADIRAEISAKSVVIMGVVVGNVTARERVEILATGSVTGEIRTPRLALADGGFVCGRVEMTD